ncbi:hypothetical protein QR680_016943 [Steinernema hermaphroditum]|uniref:RING-type domain-containing protein n=1 Tax=Steinernema hermaphroditum TaxID=289476 RepID=A0AA39HCS6_9BILA|nr:hypothetical protein QR680_016943 [Steinernema hermaphroditum]
MDSVPYDFIERTILCTDPLSWPSFVSLGIGAFLDAVPRISQMIVNPEIDVVRLFLKEADTYAFGAIVALEEEGFAKEMVAVVAENGKTLWNRRRSMHVVASRILLEELKKETVEEGEERLLSGTNGEGKPAHPFSIRESSGFRTATNRSSNRARYTPVEAEMAASLPGITSIVLFLEKVNLEDMLPRNVAVEGVRRFEFECRFEGEKMLCSSVVEVAEERVREDTDPKAEKNESSRAQRHFDDVSRISSRIFTTRRCDGPCGKVKPLREMVVLGRCEHVICFECDEFGAKVCNTSGGSGCPNQKCLQLDLALLCRNPEKRRLKLRRLLMMKSVERSSSRAPQKASDASEESVYLDYDTDAEVEKSFLASISVCLLEDAKAPPVDLLRFKLFPKDASLLSSVRAILFGSEQERLKIENIKDRCFVANSSDSREEWRRVSAQDWKSELSAFTSPSGEIRLVIDFTF